MISALSILVVDDDESTCALVRAMLSKEKCRVEIAKSGEEAVKVYSRGDGKFDAVLLDIRMPGMSGLEALAEIRRIDPGATVVMMSTISAIETAVEAMKLGAEDYLTKPLNREEIVKRLVRRVSDRKTLERRAAALKQELLRQATDDIDGASSEIERVRAEICTVAGSDVTVLITGESGAGKELVARSIHAVSSRRGEPFVAINCAAVPRELLESEFFGHEKGAFSGAATLKYGLFEVADCGTLFLDEIGDMHPDLQAKLLRTVETKEFRRLGGVETLSADVRIISATHRDLKKEIEAGRFRKDLYYRLGTFVIDVPPLRRRPADIPILVRRMIERKSARTLNLPDELLHALMRYDWPGNVRELEHVVERMLLLANGRPPNLADLPAEIHHAEAKAGSGSASDPSIPLREIEKRHILTVYHACQKDKAKTAAALGIGLKTLYRKLEEYSAD